MFQYNDICKIKMVYIFKKDWYIKYWTYVLLIVNFPSCDVPTTFPLLKKAVFLYYFKNISFWHISYNSINISFQHGGHVYISYNLGTQDITVRVELQYNLWQLTLNISKDLEMISNKIHLCHKKSSKVGDTSQKFNDGNYHVIRWLSIKSN